MWDVEVEFVSACAVALVVVSVTAWVAASVVAWLVVSWTVLLDWPQAANTKDDNSVKEPNKILFFIKPSQMVICYYFIMFQIILKDTVGRD